MVTPESHPVSPEKYHDVEFLPARELLEALYEAGLDDDCDQFGCLCDLAENGFSENEWLQAQQAQLQQMHEAHRQIGNREVLEALEVAARVIGDHYDKEVREAVAEANRFLLEQPFVFVAIDERQHARYLKSLSIEADTDDEYNFYFLTEDDDVVEVPTRIAVDPQGLTETQLRAWTAYTQKYEA